MAQLFISYAHADKAHLDRLIEWLNTNDFPTNEVWYDHHIEGGNNWRDEITTAIDESYAMLVLMTANSMDSQYCTYEWAYAMGQGMPVFPLLFEELSIDSVPAPLASRQYINCTDDIPTTFKDQLRRMKSTPPQIATLNQQVYDIIELTHRRYFVLGWIGDQFRNTGSDIGTEILIDFIRDANKAYQQLQELVLANSTLISGRQYRHCWTLIEILNRLARLQYRHNDYFPEFLFKRFENEWLPAFEYFEGDGWWRKWMQKYFYWDLSDEYNKMKVFAEMSRIFPRLDAHDMQLFIYNKANRQRLEREKQQDSNDEES